MAQEYNEGLAELREVRRKLRGTVLTVGLFSMFMNLLMLTGPLFMLQTYDRVLSARSEATLLALVMVMAFLFVIMGASSDAPWRRVSGHTGPQGVRCHSQAIGPRCAGG